MTGPHLTPEREARIRERVEREATKRPIPVNIPSALYAFELLDAERAGHAQTRADLAGQAEKAIEDVRVLRATLTAVVANAEAWHGVSHGCGFERALGVVGEWSQMALRGETHPYVARLGLVRPAPETT